MYPVAKLDHETDPPDSDSQQADSDAKFGCRRIRTGDNPDNASADYSERNEIRQYPVVHAELLIFIKLAISGTQKFSKR